MRTEVNFMVRAQEEADTLRNVEPGDWFQFWGGEKRYVMLENGTSYVNIENGKVYQTRTCCKGMDARVRIFDEVFIDAEAA